MKKDSININTNYRNQQGVTLIEILVTVLILAIGGLGVASLQLAGLKYSSGSYARTQAVILADDMANRIKSNRRLALDLNNQNGTVGGASPYRVAAFGTTVTSTRNCLEAECDRDELAQHDLSVWLDEVARVLPAGQGRILTEDRADTEGVLLRHFQIELQWRQIASSTTEAVNDDEQVKSVIYRITI